MNEESEEDQIEIYVSFRKDLVKNSSCAERIIYGLRKHILEEDDMIKIGPNYVSDTWRIKLLDNIRIYISLVFGSSIGAFLGYDKDSDIERISFVREIFLGEGLERVVEEDI